MLYTEICETYENYYIELKQHFKSTDVVIQIEIQVDRTK
jgi:hypothetical protein